jgi:hypothetical protein
MREGKPVVTWLAPIQAVRPHQNSGLAQGIVDLDQALIRPWQCTPCLESKDKFMKIPRPLCVVLFAFATSVSFANPAWAVTGLVRVTVAKAGFIVGGGGGRGVLTFRHRTYPFTVQGLSLDFTAGASMNKLVGRAEYVNELRDFSGTYSVIGAGAALFGGVGGVQLKNDKGVIITLQGPKAGVEVSANVTKVVITLDPSHSTPD